jgi:hypothetical protein
LFDDLRHFFSANTGGAVFLKGNKQWRFWVKQTPVSDYRSHEGGVVGSHWVVHF